MTQQLIELQAELSKVKVTSELHNEWLYIDLGSKFVSVPSQNAVSTTLVIDYYDGFQFGAELVDYSVNCASIEPAEVEATDYAELSPADFAKVVATEIANLPILDEVLGLGYDL